MVYKRKSKRNNRKRVVSKRSIKAMVQGASIRTSPDPPQFTLAPWWPITIMVAIKGKTPFSAKVISTSLVAQLPTFKDVIDKLKPKFRLSMIRAWSPTFVILQIANAFEQKDYRPIADFNSANHFAHVGYRFGDTEGERVFEHTDDVGLFTVHTKNVGMVYLSVLISFETAASYQRVYDHLYSVRIPSLASMAID